MRCFLFSSLALLSAICPPLLKGRGLDHAIPRVDWGDPLHRGLAVADFDKDNKSDGAVLVRHPHWDMRGPSRLEVHLSHQSNVELVFQTSLTALEVSAQDVDNDSDNDLVVAQSLTSRGVMVWINDGAGGFQRTPIENYPFLSKGNPFKLRIPAIRDLPQLLALRFGRTDPAEAPKGTLEMHRGEARPHAHCRMRNPHSAPLGYHRSPRAPPGPAS